MFLVVKRTVLVVLGLIILLASGVGVVQISALSYKAGEVVVIDAGHGGMDGGVVGTRSGVKESELNLMVARSLRHMLTKRGASVKMTRKNSLGLYDVTAKNKKLSDMQKRKEIILEAKPDAVVSIHQNSYPLSSVSGAQVFYKSGSEEGQRLAHCIQNALNSSLGGDRKIKTGDYYILNCSPYPSALVECGFLSNEREEGLLLSAEYRERIAYAIEMGIRDFLQTPSSPQ